MADYVLGSLSMLLSDAHSYCPAETFAKVARAEWRAGHSQNAWVALQTAWSELRQMQQSTAPGGAGSGFLAAARAIEEDLVALQLALSSRNECVAE